MTATDGAGLIVVNNIPSVLDGVTLNGDLAATQARVFIRSGSTLQGSVLLDRGGNITFEGTQTLSSGSVIFRDASPGFGVPNTLTRSPNTTLTLGPEVVVRGKRGALDRAGCLPGNAPGHSLSFASNHPCARRSMGWI